MALEAWFHVQQRPFDKATAGDNGCFTLKTMSDAEEEFVASDGGGAEEEEEQQEKTGTFVFPDGSKYDGGWILNDEGLRVRHGYGVYVEGPEKYEGEWNEDSMDGAGKFFFASGAMYEGNFSENEFSGQGTYKWADGAIYKGTWRSNKMHGGGSYTDPSGVEWKGQFYNGKLDNGRSHVLLR